MGDGNLWHGIALPTWDRKRFYDLFMSINGGKGSKFENDQFGRLLMVLIAVHAGRLGWRRTFAQHRIDPEEAAATVITRLLTKISENRVKLRAPCELVCIDVFNLAIRNELIGVQRNQVRRSAMRVPQLPEHSDKYEPDSRSAGINLQAFESHLLAQEDAVCEVPGTTPGIRVIYRVIAGLVIGGHPVRPFAEIPESIRGMVTAYDYAIATTRLHEIIERYAADLSAAAT